MSKLSIFIFSHKCKFEDFARIEILMYNYFVIWKCQLFFLIWSRLYKYKFNSISFSVKIWKCTQEYMSNNNPHTPGSAALPLLWNFLFLYPPQTKFRGYIVILMSVRSFVRSSVRCTYKGINISGKKLDYMILEKWWIFILQKEGRGVVISIDR